MNKRLRQFLFTSVVVMGVSAFLYVHFVLIGSADDQLIGLSKELTGESQAYLPDWELILRIGETLKDLFAHPS